MFAFIGTPEYIAIGVVIALLFGAKRLPELGRSLGDGIREFRKSTRGVLDEDEKTEGKKSGDSSEKT